MISPQRPSSRGRGAIDERHFDRSIDRVEAINNQPLCLMLTLPLMRCGMSA